MKKKSALITGSGQDASYLAEFLLDKEYRVIMFSKRTSVYSNNENVKHLFKNPNFSFLDGDITDGTFVNRVLAEYQPDEYYATAAESHVAYSFKNPASVLQINTEAVAIQLDLIRQTSPHTKFLNCASSEIFGGTDCPQEGYTEKSSLNPRSPYAVSKAASFYLTKNYRESYNLFAVSSICFNHSSVRRGHDFATRKISRGVASVKLGLQDKVKMGNLEAFRDEGAAQDYVRAMWIMLQQDVPDDYLIATGTGATIGEMLEYVCDLAGLKFSEVYEQDPQFLRPSDVPYLKGDPSKARLKLDWEPTITWQDLLKNMYEHDLKTLK